MEIKLKDNERIDDLEFKGLKIIQNTQGFCFGMDAVLLSDFAKNIKNKSKVIDLGTGTGIISILLCEKTKLEKIVSVELQKEVFEMANRSVKLNNLEKKMEVINHNIKDLKKIYEQNTFDVVVSNPPYKKNGTGILNEKDKKTISRHEIEANLEDFIKISKYLLKDKGEIYLVHRPDRLVDILSIMREHKIEPKTIKFVAPRVNEKPNLLLIKGIKNGKPFLDIEKTLYVYKNKDEYTDELLEIYNKGEN